MPRLRSHVHDHECCGDSLARPSRRSVRNSYKEFSVHPIPPCLLTVYRPTLRAALSVTARISTGVEMADDKSKRGAQDRRTVSGSERYELDYEAEKLGISPEQLKAIIARVGTDRAKIEQAAGRIKK